MGSEVLIIGGGVIGLSIARELQKKGVKQVTIVDRGHAGAEASWAAAGMLAPNIEADANADFHRFGTESIALYPAFADALLEETGIDIELDRTGTLCIAFDGLEAAELSETYDRQRNRDVPVEHLTGDEIRGREPAISTGVFAGLFYPDDWQVENRKLVAALRKFADDNGIRIVENAEVSELISDGSRIRGARTLSDVLEADITVLATGAWTSLIKIGGAAMPFGVRPIRGQMISLAPEDRLLRHVVYSPRGYLVPRVDGRILVGATVEDEGFEKTTTTEAIASLASAAAEIIPRLSRLAIVEQWSGLRPFAADGLPVIGGLPGYESVFVATAHYRNGILLAPLTARIVAEKILNGRDSEYLRVFGAGRFPSAARLASGS